MTYRMRAIADSQTGIAKKVLAAVPIQSPWEVRKIVAEIARTGPMPDKRIVEGCLRSLCDSGLIRESPFGFFQRIEIKEEPIVQQKTAEKNPKDPSEVFNRLNNVANMLKTIINELEEIALTVEEQRIESSEEAKKIKQFKELLKALT